MFFSNLKDNLTNNSAQNISGDEAFKIINSNDNVLILDVRNFDEYSYSHIPKAKNIPANDIICRLNQLTDYINSPIIIYCSSGIKSSVVANILVKNNFKNIFNLYKGLKDWNHPIEFTVDF